MHTNRTRGFTLIELLVVIAIIGVLSAVVLASLSTARSRGNDAAIRSNISGIQTEADIYLLNNNNYGTPAAAVNGSCTTANSLFMIDATVKNAITAVKNINNGGTVTCYQDIGPSTKYAIQAQLVNNPLQYFCVDSVGNATTSTTLLAATHC